MTTTRPRATCPRCSRDVALVGKASSRPAQHKCLGDICWPRVDDRPPAARLEFTGPEHAMFAEILLAGPRDDRYESPNAQIAAAAVHVQLAQLALEAGDALRGWARDASAYEWAQCLAVRSPADTADVELAVLPPEAS
jgi:hypothetical protein